MFGIVAGMMVYIVIAHLLPGKSSTGDSVYLVYKGIDAYARCPVWAYRHYET